MLSYSTSVRASYSEVTEHWESSVPYPPKIVDRAEVRTWILEGRTYKWMVEEYWKKYKIQIGTSAFSNFRAENGLPYRQGRNAQAKIIPWKIADPRHRRLSWYTHLRMAARLEDGLPVPQDKLESLQRWWAGMEAGGSVVDYRPDLLEPFIPVPRRPGIDKGYIREPDPDDPRLPKRQRLKVACPS